MLKAAMIQVQAVICSVGESKNTTIERIVVVSAGVVEALALSMLESSISDHNY